MVHLQTVGELVHDNVVKYLLRGEDEPPVEVEIAGAAAAPPAGLLFPDRDAVVSHVHEAGVVGGLDCEDIPRRLHVAGPFTLRERFLLRDRMALYTRQMFLYPAPLFTHKGVNFRA